MQQITGDMPCITIETFISVTAYSLFQTEIR